MYICNDEKSYRDFITLSLLFMSQFEKSNSISAGERSTVKFTISDRY